MHSIIKSCISEVKALVQDPPLHQCLCYLSNESREKVSPKLVLVTNG